MNDLATDFQNSAGAGAAGPILNRVAIDTESDRPCPTPAAGDSAETHASSRREPRSLIGRVARNLASRAARAYVAGESLDDALAARESLARAGHLATLGYWSDGDDDPAAVFAQYRATLAALGAGGHGGYCSAKLPALGFRKKLMDGLALAARDAGVALHCDSHGPEDVDRTRGVIERWQECYTVAAGTTLPGRWRRSVDDALWTNERGLPARVVKGQWADPADPNRDQRAGFLEVIDALAGRATKVAVATHDVPLALEAIGRLRRGKTPVRWELLHGLPMREAPRAAAAVGVETRVYVPFGRGYLPYALRRLATSPRMWSWLLKDLIAGSLSRGGRATG